MLLLFLTTQECLRQVAESCPSCLLAETKCKYFTAMISASFFHVRNGRLEETKFCVPELNRCTDPVVLGSHEIVLLSSMRSSRHDNCIRVSDESVFWKPGVFWISDCHERHLLAAVMAAERNKCQCSAWWLLVENFRFIYVRNVFGSKRSPNLLWYLACSS